MTPSEELEYIYAKAQAIASKVRAGHGQRKKANALCTLLYQRIKSGNTDLALTSFKEELDAHGLVIENLVIGHNKWFRPFYQLFADKYDTIPHLDNALSNLSILHGSRWNHWVELMVSYMEKQSSTIGDKRYALIAFYRYLADCAPYAWNLFSFFTGENGHLCSSTEFIKHSGVGSAKANTYSKLIESFIDGIIADCDITENGDNYRLFNNPMKTSGKRNNHSAETNKTPLPMRYVKDLRQIVCPYPAGIKKQDGTINSAMLEKCNFSDWTWAQELDARTDNTTGQTGDWFFVDESMIDKSDPDCVWRVYDGRCVSKRGQYQIWSPVKWALVWLKLQLPLRTYQARMLDSGEADTWRYEKGQWVENNRHPFVVGSIKRPSAKGIFKRIFDSYTEEYSTGLYINTNKTADQNKDEIDRGYTIPWQHEEVLYWLEKLRNWQEKYNPIDKPTPWTELTTYHLKNAKSTEQLAGMGETCFLFRDPSVRGDKDKPVSDVYFARAWYQTLKKLEQNLADAGHTLSDGTRLKLVACCEGKDIIEDNKIATYFPPHSLRVTLITAYAMDTSLPLPVISKLLAGHSRLLMTIYYNKLTPSMMAKKMKEAEAQLDENETASVRAFLADASLQQIKCKMAYHDEGSIDAAMVNRNPIGWEKRHAGLCLAGGNTVQVEGNRSVGGCWNGGPLLKPAKDPLLRVYASVPHGPENCTRCRWFITDARYLPQLNAHLNQLSYKAHAAANLSVELEAQLDILRDEQFECEDQHIPFTKHDELQALSRRHEKQTVEADEYTQDWISCFNLIHRINTIENNREQSDTGNKLIAVGSEEDLSFSVKFMETDSELLHLSLLCDDAEFYPDLQDDLKKTPAIAKRTMHISKLMQKNGLKPIFIEMDEQQQLLAINALIREMARIANQDDKLEGFRVVSNYLEAGNLLEQQGLFQSGLEAIQQNILKLKVEEQKPMLEVVK